MNAAAGGIAAAFCASTSRPQLVALVGELGQFGGDAVAAAVGAVERRTGSATSSEARRASAVEVARETRGFGFLAFRRRGARQLAFAAFSRHKRRERERALAVRRWR